MTCYLIPAATQPAPTVAGFSGGRHPENRQRCRCFSIRVDDIPAVL